MRVWNREGRILPCSKPWTKKWGGSRRPDAFPTLKPQRFILPLRRRLQYFTGSLLSFAVPVAQLQDSLGGVSQALPQDPGLGQVRRGYDPGALVAVRAVRAVREWVMRCRLWLCLPARDSGARAAVPVPALRLLLRQHLQVGDDLHPRLQGHRPHHQRAHGQGHSLIGICETVTRSDEVSHMLSVGVCDATRV